MEQVKYERSLFVIDKIFDYFPYWNRTYIVLHYLDNFEFVFIKYIK